MTVASIQQQDYNITLYCLDISFLLVLWRCHRYWHLHKQGYLPWALLHLLPYHWEKTSWSRCGWRVIHSGRLCGKHVSHCLQWITHTQFNDTLLHIYRLDTMQCYRLGCYHPHMLTSSLSKPNPPKESVTIIMYAQRNPCYLAYIHVGEETTRSLYSFMNIPTSLS